MPFIIKAAPSNAMSDGSLVLTERPFYEGGRICEGDEIFVWFSETYSGRGLVGSGRVERVEAAAGGRLSVRLRLLLQPLREFGNSVLERHRNVNDGTPIAGLARKLYRHSHNKIAELSVQEADFLREHLSPDTGA